MLFLIVLILLLALFGGYLAVRNRRRTAEETQAVQNLAVERRRFPWQRHRYQQGRALQAWIAENLTDKTAKPWVEQLSPAEAQSLAQALQAFGEQNGFDAQRLLAGAYDDNADLRKVIKEAITKYLAAHAVMEKAQDDLAASHMYQRILDGKAKEAFVQDLYATLIHRDLAPQPDPSVLAASSRERAHHRLEAIQASAQTDWKAFVSVMNEVRDERDKPQEQEKAVADSDKAPGRLSRLAFWRRNRAADESAENDGETAATPATSNTSDDDEAAPLGGTVPSPA